MSSETNSVGSETSSVGGACGPGGEDRGGDNNRGSEVASSASESPDSNGHSVGDDIAGGDGVESCTSSDKSDEQKAADEAASAAETVAENENQQRAADEAAAIEATVAERENQQRAADEAAAIEATVAEKENQKKAADEAAAAALAGDLGLPAAEVTRSLNPEATKAPEGYTVAAGDTLSNIAATHGVELSDVLAKNPDITNPDQIEVGQQINLPDGAQKHDVAGVQSTLAAQGYAVGPIDGIAGPKTEAALRSFQRANGLNATGRIDGATAKALSSTPSASEPTAAPATRSIAGAAPVTTATINGPLGRLLDQIALGEGTSQAKAQARGFRSGYDVTLGYGAYTPAAFKGKNLTDLTIGQVKQLQAGMLNNPKNPFNSSAVGRYQIVGKTLNSLTRQMGIPDSAKFTPALQDRMATALLEGRGLKSFQSGRISARSFQNRIAKEWASVATATTGRSYYRQATGTSSATIRGLIDNLR